VRTDVVKDISFEGGIVKIVVDLDESHQFAAAIKNDITEKIEPLWDVELVEVEFTG
jgi:hypothetical protein